MALLKQLQTNTSPGPEYEADDGDLPVRAAPPIRLIAYYLPQFHPIPENDEWWGRGFTEWTNVTKALPRYVGHYQPRLPGSLGFYDLRLSHCLREQAALAKRYGIGGFCFHHYWFGGRRLLETPLQLLLEHREIDLPFCLNWANEPWSRVWDGSERRLLMEQKHSPDDDLAFAAAIEPALADPRYIRINGRPLLMLYRPGLLPDAAATAARWREHFRARGLDEPYLVMAYAFGDSDPRIYGMDAAAGFPPHPFGWDLPSQTETLTLLDPEFRGRVMSYDALASIFMAQPAMDFPFFPGICPNWDNDARRPGRGTVFAGASPRTYGVWLEHVCRRAMQAQNAEERIVFINAWNEWAEGAYLEPDRHFGYAYLRETARTLARLGGPAERRPAGRDAFLAVDQRNARGHSQNGLRGLIHALRRRGANAAETLADAIRPD